MDMFRKPRLAWAKGLVRRRLRKTYRNKKFNNLRNAHKIGIVWDGSNLESFRDLTAFFQLMTGKGIQVDILCYYPGTVLPDEYTALRHLSCFKRSDLSFFYLPKSEEISDFISTPYEILIDINFNNRFPLYYITALSKAEFKIGKGGSIKQEALDMSIELDDKNNISFYLEQVQHYLEMINTGV